MLSNRHVDVSPYFTVEMNSNQDFRASRVWNTDKPNWKGMLSQNSAPRVVIEAEGRHASQAIGLNHRVSHYAIHQVSEDPWQTYEPIVGVFQGHRLCLARRITKKTEFVNIQQWVNQNGPVAPLIETMSQSSHPSFLSLLECYYHGDDAFLVWEPVEISVNHILASQCPITEAEIAAIVKPVS